MSQQNIPTTLTTYVDAIIATYPNGTGSESAPTLLTNNGVKYYDPMGTIAANPGDSVQINCVDGSSEGVSINAIALSYENGDHIGVSEASASGSLFTINANTLGEEAFYVEFSFNSGGKTYCCKIDPKLQVAQ